MEAPIPAERVTIVPASDASWEDLTAIFGTSDAGPVPVPVVQGRGLDLAGLHAGGADGDAPGADRLRRPRAQRPRAGWWPTSMASRPAGSRSSRAPPTPSCARLACRGSGRDEDKGDDGVWAVTCFVVRKGYRGRGLTYLARRATVDFARERGARALEAYPMVTQPGKEITWGELHVGRPSGLRGRRLRGGQPSHPPACGDADRLREGRLSAGGGAGSAVRLHRFHAH